MKQFFMLLIPMLTTLGCSSLPAKLVTDSKILENARNRAQKYCSTFKDGCDYKITSDNNGWSVLITPIVMDQESGRRFIGIDSDDMYFYNQHGLFTGALRGH